MLAFKCQNLVISLGGLSSKVKTVFVGTTRLVFKVLNCFLHLADALLRKKDFMPHAVDANSKTLVFALDVI